MYLWSWSVEQTIFVTDREFVQMPKFLIKTGIENILSRHMYSIKTNLAFFSMTACETWRVSMLFIYRCSETHSLYLSTLMIDYSIHSKTAFYITHHVVYSPFISLVHVIATCCAWRQTEGELGGQEWDHKLEEMQWHSHVLKEFNFHSFKFMTVRHRTIGASVQCLVVCLWVNGSHLYVHCVRLNHVEYSEVQLYPSYIVWSYHLYCSVTLENNSNTGHFQICNYCLWPRKWQKKKKSTIGEQNITTIMIFLICRRLIFLFSYPFN